MKKSTLISSHFLIFALGASIAIISTRQAKKQEADALLAATDPASVAFSHSQAQDSKAGPRTSREPSDRPARTRLAPKEALVKITEIGDAYERQRALMDFLDDLAPDQFAAVADQYRELNHYGNTGDELELLFRAWAKTDPLTALSYIEENPDMRRNRGEVLETWAGADPKAAENWAIQAHDGEGANPYMAAVIKGIAATDIETASRLTQEMPLSRERGRAIDAMAKALLMKGEDVAFAFTDSIADEQLKGSFVMIISQNLSRQDPQAAADWVASLEKGDLQSRASGEVARRLARLDVDKAASFVTSLEPEAQAAAAAATIPAMSQNDIAGTAKWVSSLAGTPGYDRVVESFVWSCDERAPEQSAAWIRGVSNPQQQLKLYHRMLGGWAKKDPAAVRQWVASNQVPESVVRRFSN
ncbi:hypothetical protein ACFSSA_14455 [Luteolibacter algae]|uniref:HEAT repeat domain-containing protein n=1 Tax=Luteolibacter algae TaxID=454151 RepID=A0ABW5DCX6_9BACT